MQSMAKVSARARAARTVAAEVFGFRVKPFVILNALYVVRAIQALSIKLDTVFFGINKVEVKKPIVIIGNHRTGSTFLQRFLHDNGFGSGMKLYQLLYPSLTLQVFIRPFLPILEYFSPTKHHDQEVHKTGLTIVETDDAGLTFRFFDGFFLYGFVLSFLEEADLLDQFNPQNRDTSARDWPWLAELWKRNLRASGHTRVIAKLFSATPQVPNFVDKHPDAKMLYLARDPVNVIPSTMSLLVGVLSQAGDFWELPEPVRERFLTRIYAAVIMLMQRFHDDWTEGRIPKENVKIVRFDRLMSEFEVMMDEICEFCELDMSDAQRDAIAKRGEKQRAYKSKHKYDLAKFGLSEDKIREDCAFFYEAFLPPLDKSAAAEG